MNTFLPYQDIMASLKCLDRQRLGKQRLEAWQILRALRGRTRGWRNHPATLMWRGHERWLALYGAAACKEWRWRGYKDRMLPRFLHALERLRRCPPPSWMGDEAFHASHRSNLLRKDRAWYGRFGWKEPPTLPYVWPTPSPLPAPPPARRRSSDAASIRERSPRR